MTHRLLLRSPVELQPAACGAALWALLAVAWFAFAPGTGGTFIFDDYANLHGLDRAQAGTLAGWGQYIFDGLAGALGRPLSLLTFAAQAHSWPHHPEDFIRANILIHLLNGALLCWALLRLLRLSPVPGVRAEVVAVFATALWLLAPLHSGAVLYVVQRMTVLAGGFMLLGLLAYVVGRGRLESGRPVAGLTLMSAGVGVGLGLGVFAKENAIVFPLLLLVVEATLLAKLSRPVAWRRWAWLFLGLPLALFAGYLLWRLPSDVAAVSYLGVSSPERVLSQPRILLGYLGKFFLPSLYGIRIMYDDLAVSRSLLSPWTTLPSLLACIAMLGAAIRYRRRWPVAAFAVLWFFAAHSLEASFIPLELAFDHRNYIAVAGPALLLVVAIGTLLRRPEAQRLRGGIVLFSAAYLLFTAVAQWNAARLWAQPYELAAYWQQVQPDSRRVSYHLSDTHLQNGNPVAAMQERYRALERWPGDASSVVSLFSIGCLVGDAPVPSLETFRFSLARFDAHVYSVTNLIDRLLLQVENGLCTRYSADFLLEVVERTYSLPQLRSKRVNYHLLRARIYHAAGQAQLAIDELARALDRDPSPDVFEVAITWALDSGDRERALALLDQAERATAGHPLFRASYAPAFAELRRKAGAPKR